MPSESAGKRQG